MSDTTTGDATTDTTTVDDADTNTTTVDGQGDQDDKAAKAGREAADLRRRLKAAEKQLDEYRAAGQTELERAQAKAEAAERQAGDLLDRLQAVTLDQQVQRTARDLGIVDPAMASRLIDRGQVTWQDGAADPESVKRALKDLVKEFPRLTRSGDVDATTGGELAAGSGLDGRVNAALHALRP